MYYRVNNSESDDKHCILYTVISSNMMFLSSKH